MELVTVMLQDVETYRKYRKVLLARYPKKEGMGWPTYLVVSNPEGDFTIHGEVKGRYAQGRFPPAPRRPAAGRRTRLPPAADGTGRHGTPRPARLHLRRWRLGFAASSRRRLSVASMNVR